RQERGLTSDRKIRANRANARASTGPKTAQGRARAARNALRYGLSLPVQSDPALSEELEALAREIAGPNATGEIRELARRVAEPQIELRRVRYARHQLLSRALSDPCYGSRAEVREKTAVLMALLRPKAPEIPLAALDQYFLPMPEGPEKFAIILSREA